MHVHNTSAICKVIEIHKKSQGITKKNSPQNWDYLWD